ncbi:hypothetical protein EHM69_05560 [candidate division KSB1 bacterium]|nr:MAG: hypothetical protein EHM69_05560 [candidate division KSB1 bacterium]
MHSYRKAGREGQDKGRIRPDRGMIMIVALLLLAGLIFVAGTAAIHSTRGTQISAVELDNTRTFYAAEGAVEWGAGELKNLLDHVLDPTLAELDALPAPTLPGYTLETYQVSKVGILTEELISSGDYTGLRGYVQRYSVQARASSQRRSTEISREIQHQFIPLFQFGVFYEEDLEIFPGASMTFTGPIHTNGDLYMGADGSIQCNSTVTCVGQYWHYRKDGGHSDPPGPVTIRTPLGTYQGVWRGAFWLDNRYANWASEALAVWGGNVRDAAHGLHTLRLPLPPTADQHVVVERGVMGDTQLEREAKYWYKATVRYVDGVLTDSAGNPLSHPGVYTYTANKFKDQRLNKYMDVVDINIGAMLSGGYVPTNRILYISHASGDAPAIRIKNAATLPVGGLTIATDLPLYVWGNYNTTAKKGSALLCDAITLLSPSWSDANSALAIDSRIPSNMGMNACIMTGHVNTVSGSTYSGGLENDFRFLEKWTGYTVTFRGSIINLWFSRKATAPWVYGAPVYTAPNRNWGYDTDLLSPSNWPPGTPRVHTVQRGHWRQIS